MTYNNNNKSDATNLNYNVNSGTQTINNNNVTRSENLNTNMGTMTYNNNNVSTSNSTVNNVQTGDMTNRNFNQSVSASNNVNTNNNVSNSINQNVQTGDMTNRNINETSITQRVIQPPPTAIAPAMMSGGSPDLCTTGQSGAVQTQFLGMALGGTQRDMNCERLKLSKTLYDMGMKVAAVATMCQDRRVFDAMMMAGTPCPYEGLIGEQAKEAWLKNPDKMPKLTKENG
jgi:hypothetical protein